MLLYNRGEYAYEIHFIDSPGFNDGTLNDTQVLSKIASFINTTYRLGERLAGVLYLHDITKAKGGGMAKRNLRMLEEMLGGKKWDNCTLVTTKWGCSNPADEADREKSLKEHNDYFGAMLRGEEEGRKAGIERFDPKNKQRALEIIEPFLTNTFVAQISEQMAVSTGPMLPLGETSAGKVVKDNLEDLAQANQDLAKVEAAKQILAQKFDEELFKEFKDKRKKLRRKIKAQRAGRWIIRMTILGGAITATVLTTGPGAGAFALQPAYEQVAQTQRKGEREARAKLEQDFRRQAAMGHVLKDKSSEWLWDKKVKDLEDLNADRYSLASSGDDDVLKVAEQGAVVGTAGPEMVADLESVVDEEDTSGSDDDEKLEEW